MTSADASTPSGAAAIPEDGATGYATEPAHLPKLIFEAYNAGDLDAVERLFEPDALLVVEPGRTVAGADRRAALGALLARGPRFTGTVRHIFEHDDIALIVNDFVHEETDEQGRTTRSEGTATDVVRRDRAGHWRYAIDNPWGTAG